VIVLAVIAVAGSHRGSFGGWRARLRLPAALARVD
jgi:hypothetical protein